MLHGGGVKVLPDVIADIAKPPAVMAAMEAAGRVPGQRLQGEDDREAVTAAMQKKMAALGAFA